MYSVLIYITMKFYEKVPEFILVLTLCRCIVPCLRSLGPLLPKKLSGRSKKIQDEWKRLCEKRNVVPGQQFHLLLSGRELSAEALRRKVRRIATPKRVTPSKLLKLFTVNNFITFLGHLGY